MQKPNMGLIVDTFFPIRERTLDAYIEQLRRELIPEIRKLKNNGKIIWYSFLIHDHTNLTHKVPVSEEGYVHIRLGLPDGADVSEFIRELPTHFQDPRHVSLDKIEDVNVSILKEQDWAYAWKALGEASEWVLCFIEDHDPTVAPSVSQIVQFLHFITNSFMIGNRSVYLETGRPF